MRQRRLIMHRHRINMHSTNTPRRRNLQRAEMRPREYSRGEPEAMPRGHLGDEIQGVGFGGRAHEADDRAEGLGAVKGHFGSHVFDYCWWEDGVIWVAAASASASGLVDGGAL